MVQIHPRPLGRTCRPPFQGCSAGRGRLVLSQDKRRRFDSYPWSLSAIRRMNEGEENGMTKDERRTRRAEKAARLHERKRLRKVLRRSGAQQRSVMSALRSGVALSVGAAWL